MKNNIILLAGFILFSPFFLSAQEERTSKLFIDLRKSDSLLFDRGFNNCDFAALEDIIGDDLEFYHDQGGIQNREQFFKAIKENICAPSPIKPLRKLLDSTLVVYPLSSNGVLYGAVQMGTHDFYISEPGKELRFTSRAKFIHTWIIEGDSWKLKRVLSFDHRQP